MAWWKRGKSESVAETVAAAERAAGMPLIRLEGVSRVFKGDANGAEEETCALDNVTLDIERGQYVSVSGPSGCGKSTFLSVLALLDSPTSGRYYFNGRRVDQLSAGEKARVRNVDVGLIFQSFNLIGDMTVHENIEYPLTLRGVAGDERRWPGSGSPPAPSSVRGRSPAATSSSWRSRAPSPAVRRSSSPTSRRGTWIRRAAKR
jgi:ABC-type sugar transport system ATPase subunit